MIRTFTRGDETAYLAQVAEGGYVLKERRGKCPMFHAANCWRLDLVTLNWSGKIGEPRHWAPIQRELFDYAEDKYEICPACEGIRRSPRRR